MPRIITGPAADGVANTRYPDDAAQTANNTFTVDFSALSPAAAVGDIIDLGELGPYCTVLDCMIVADKVDTGSALQYDVGLMSGDVGSNDAARTCGNEFFEAATAGRTATVVRAEKPAGLTLPRSHRYSRSIGVKILALPAGINAGAKVHFQFRIQC